MSALLAIGVGVYVATATILLQEGRWREAALYGVLGLVCALADLIHEED